MECAGRCWAGGCCHEACLPPTLGMRDVAASSWSPVAIQTGLTRALSSGQWHRGQSRGQNRPRSQVPGQLLQPGQAKPRQETYSASPSSPLRGAEVISSRKIKKA